MTIIYSYIYVIEPGYLSAIALGYGVDDRRFEFRQRLGIFLFTTASRPALGAHPASYPMGNMGSFSGGKTNDRDVKLTTHFQLVPRSRMRGAIPPLHQCVLLLLQSNAGGHTFGPQLQTSCCNLNKRFRKALNVQYWTWNEQLRRMK
jgi:hypothetical protein